MIAQSLGSDLDAANPTLTITHNVHYVTGTVGMGVSFSTMNPPSPSFSGIVTLINKGPNGGIFWNTSGNILRPGAIGVDQAVQFYYNSNTSKWHPIDQ